MLLSRLLSTTTDVVVSPSAAIEVAGLTADSRAVGAGFLFAALPGVKVDGRSFIADAAAKGAAAVLAPRGTTLPEGAGHLTLIEADNPRLAFARIAAAFHAPQPETVVAVTGTNGKTSTVQYARQIWTKLGFKAASLGTLGLIGPGIDRYGSMTTPDPVALHRDLAEVAGLSVTHLAMEASSHGLDQFRLDGVRVKAAGFTNLTRDHLDYHKTFDAYLAAKARLSPNWWTPTARPPSTPTCRSSRRCPPFVPTAACGCWAMVWPGGRSRCARSSRWRTGSG